MATPRQVDVAITNGCNLRCRYCYHFGGAADAPGDLPAAEWRAFFAELQALAVMEVHVSGGEPFHRRDLPLLLQDLDERPFRTVLYTNGTLIGPAEARLLAGLRRLKGVQISLDGGRPESHDPLRGKGTFAKAVRGITLLREHGVAVRVRVTLHRQNVDDLEETARYLLEEVGLPSFSVNSAYDMGLCSRDASSVQLTPDQRSRAMETLLRLETRYPRRLSATAGPLAQLRHWTAMQRARRDGETWPQGGALSACGGVFRKLAVRADGAIVPCHQLSHVVLGRVGRDPLQQVWRSHAELEGLRSRRDVPLEALPPCRDCEWRPWCTGGCPAMAVSDEHCLRRFLDSGGRLPLA